MSTLFFVLLYCSTGASKSPPPVHNVSVLRKAANAAVRDRNGAAWQNIQNSEAWLTCVRAADAARVANMQIKVGEVGVKRVVRVAEKEDARAHLPCAINRAAGATFDRKGVAVAQENAGAEEGESIFARIIEGDPVTVAAYGTDMKIGALFCKGLNIRKPVTEEDDIFDIGVARERGRDIAALAVGIGNYEKLHKTPPFYEQKEKSAHILPTVTDRR